MQTEHIVATVVTVVTAVGLRIVGAFILWIIGRGLIRFALTVVTRALARQHVDVTLSRYVRSGMALLLNIALVASILGFFGVETTTFAALVAAGGVAIGLAWGGLLANFAAGAFLMALRPYKIGDLVTAGGVTGTVDAIGLFGTTINTPDHVQTIVGNNRIFSDTIQNYSANPYRRVDLTATIDNSVSHERAIGLLRQRLGAIPHVLLAPAPEVDVLEFTQAGPLLCVRPCCKPEHYWQVYFDTTRMIRETFTTAGFPVPVAHLSVHGAPTAA